MQILIQVNTNIKEDIEKVLSKIEEGYRYNLSDPCFRIIDNYAELPMSDEEIEEYTKQKVLERMYKTLSKGFDPFE